jgi:hypothetical protein
MNKSGETPQALLPVKDDPDVPGKRPADHIVKLVRQIDELNFIIGTRINIAHQDPNLPVELEMRRTVVKQMARLLEEKFLKEVSIRYI